MVYSTRRRRYTRYGTRYARRPTRRVSTGYSRRRYVRKRVMPRAKRSYTRKRILAVSSRKKLDTMLPYELDGAYDDTGNPGGATFNMTSRVWAFGFVATARSLAANTTNRGIVSDDATRTATECYMKSYTERILVQLEINQPVRWRRVCFTWKSPFLVTSSVALGGTGAEGHMWIGNDDGYHRALTQLFPSSGDTNVIWQQFLDIMFMGEFQKDWTDIILAPLDKRRITVKSDHTTVIQSKNDVGTIRQFRRSYRLSHTLVYNDDEQGGGKRESVLSSLQRKSMGDYYIIDLFDLGLGIEGQTVNFTPEGQLRWTER